MLNQINMYGMDKVEVALARIKTFDVRDDGWYVAFSGGEEILERAIERYGPSLQMDVLIEEMSELTKEIIKYKRATNRNEKLHRIETIAEETADVKIMLDQITKILGIKKEVESEEKMKLKRLAERLER